MNRLSSVAASLEALIQLLDHEWQKIRIHSCGVWRNQGWNGPGLRFEINYYAAGRSMLSLDGLQLDLSPGRLLFQPDTVRNSSCDEGNFTVYYLNFDTDCSELNRKIRACYEALPFSEALYAAELDKAFGMLMMELQAEAARPIVIKHYFFRILIQAFQSFAAERKWRAATQNQFNELHHSFLDKIHLDKIADEHKVNANSLNRMFKQMTGRTIGQYVIRLRVDHAKRLLSHTRQSVTEIALHAGFYDTAHFCHAFKRLEKQTPEQFRRT
ncbi:helix-turn-helix transcriptional regulator [Paenibacillus arenilitoris]|uniref:Helix-turn-helix transcriptional regulator n=1 Tax=Paenibacillus arenilitoris TaxID=2772299 RepID=A0A927CJT6_9BACL|nr:helix-turn-helix transcriptional regulator [Paenibacillus arenilitoris]MBD2866995.1 helix-turn-helix transcriptional regulator [Paenibacillus arenilitoris]